MGGSEGGVASLSFCLSFWCQYDFEQKHRDTFFYLQVEISNIDWRGMKIKFDYSDISSPSSSYLETK